MIPKAVPMIFFFTIKETLAKTQLAYMARPQPKKEKARRMKKVLVYEVEKYKISCTTSNKTVPKIDMYLLIPILSTINPEGMLNKAAEK